MLCSVGFVGIGDFRHERVVRIGIGKKRADGQQNLGNSQGRRPVVLEDVQADSSLVIHVAVVNLCGKSYLGWLERVVVGEVYFKEEDATSIRAVGRSHDSGLPFEHVVTNWSS